MLVFFHPTELSQLNACAYKTGERLSLTVWSTYMEQAMGWEGQVCRALGVPMHQTGVSADVTDTENRLWLPGAVGGVVGGKEGLGVWD